MMPPKIIKQYKHLSSNLNDSLVNIAAKIQYLETRMVSNCTIDHIGEEESMLAYLKRVSLLFKPNKIV